MKKYLIVGAVLLLLLLVVTANTYRNRYLEEKQRAVRLTDNQKELISDVNSYKQLYLSEREFRDIDNLRIDSLLSELKIKPKQVTRYVDRWHHSVDTILSIDTLYVQPDEVTWPFIDQTECFVFAGSIRIEDTVVMEVDRREYLNHTTEIAYLKRSKNFLFIRYGPWEASLQVINKCGEDEIREIQVIKK